jgi:hypothetical protein
LSSLWIASNEFIDNERRAIIMRLPVRSTKERAAGGRVADLARRSCVTVVD